MTCMSSSTRSPASPPPATPGAQRSISTSSSSTLPTTVRSSAFYPDELDLYALNNSKMIVKQPATHTSSAESETLSRHRSVTISLLTVFNFWFSVYDIIPAHTVLLYFSGLPGRYAFRMDPSDDVIVTPDLLCEAWYQEER